MRNIINQIRRIINTKQFHIYIVSLIVFIIILISGGISLKYYVEGEENLPFYLSKISIISSIDGTDVEDTKNKWNLSVNQNNDIYLYIEKNNDYKQIDAIESIKLDNFNIIKKSNIGIIQIFKPDSRAENVIFKNKKENEVKSIEYIGDMSSSVKEQKISNQGGIVVFRYAINNIGNYISNDDEEIKHTELLNKLQINNSDLEFETIFDIYINLTSGKSYKASINLSLPVNNVVKDGTQSIEYKDLKEVIFKRM